MAGPYTANTGLIVPTTGSLVDVWGDQALNPDFVAVDGLFGGVQSISLSNLPVTLTSPAAFAPTPGAGPTQSQNRVLRFTGVLSSNVTITLPIPGSYIVENLTTGAFDVIVRGVTATEIIGLPQGESHTIYNDGARVRFTDLGSVGEMVHWAGLSALPSWVGQCTVKPFLLCDASIYNVSDFPYLGARFLGKFGGNGVTTFTCPDMRGRVPVAYDGAANRVTSAGSGLDGDTIGATLDQQTVTLITANLPPYTPVGSVSTSASVSGYPVISNTTGPLGYGGTATGGNLGSAFQTYSSTFTGTAQGGTSAPVNNVQPSIITGIWVVKT